MEDSHNNMETDIDHPAAAVAGPSQSGHGQLETIEISKDDDEDSDNYEDEFETSGEENEEADYIEVNFKGQAVPTTGNVASIPKEKLLPFQKLYEKQPKKVKEMMQLKFYKGKPLVDPPPLGNFVKKLESLKIGKKSQLQQKRREQRQRYGYRLRNSLDYNNTNEEPNINVTELYESDTQLVHVDYPARIGNVDKAIATMGGVGQITKVLNNTNRKLNVKFRPEDPYCNPVKGEVHPSVGILLKVRVRKSESQKEPEKVETTEQINPVFDVESENSNSDPVVIINGIPIPRSQILEEDKKLLKSKDRESQLLSKQHNASDTGEYYLKIPKDYQPNPDPNIQIEALGIISRSYKFDGICDFQYLPLKKTEAGIVCNRNNVLPLIGNSSESEENPFVSDALLKNETEFELALLPPMMSRIDKPLDAIAENFMDTSNIKIDPSMKEKSTGVIATSRARRNVYTIFHSFPTEKSTSVGSVPSTPLEGALEDVKKRPQCANAVGAVSKLFEDKPVWGRSALEFETKLSPFALKYVLPCVAYFASNGPWRALWIRFGYDPRKQPESFMYQTIDFRIPVEYRGFMESGNKTDDTCYMFRPTAFPPRGQMFYQLCHLKCEEFETLIAIASKKCELKQLTYDLRFGWLKEGTFDYIRHVLIQYIEILLEDMGKIPEYPVQKVFLPHWELEPTGKLTPRPRKVKRLRKVRSFNPNPKPLEVVVTESTKAKKSPAKKTDKAKSKESNTWAYQGILQDLSIKEINKYGAQDEKLEIIDEVSLLLDNDEFEESDEESDENYDEADPLSTEKN